MRFLKYIIFYSIISNLSLSQEIKEYKDYYYEGQEQAKKDYLGKYGIGHFVAGTISGLAIPPLGTIYGYIYTWMYAKPVNVPKKYLTNLSEKNRKDFEEGYLTYMSENKLSKFNSGVKCGCITYLLAYSAIISSDL